MSNSSNYTKDVVVFFDGLYKVRNPNARLAGLANISIGRYMSEMKKREEDEDSFDIKKFSKSDFNKKSTETKKSTIYEFEPIDCNKTVIKEDDLSIILEFSGIKFSQSKFKFLEATNTFFITVDYKEKGSYLTLSTIEDIFEFNVFYREFDTDRIYRDELYIPELLNKYKDRTMNMKIEGDNKIIIEYR
jgi:hypothetical protein